MAAHTRVWRHVTEHTHMQISPSRSNPNISHLLILGVVTQISSVRPCLVAHVRELTSVTPRSFGLKTAFIWNFWNILRAFVDFWSAGNVLESVWHLRLCPIATTLYIQAASYKLKNQLLLC